MPGQADRGTRSLDDHMGKGNYGVNPLNYSAVQKTAKIICRIKGDDCFQICSLTYLSDILLCC